ncbi:flavin-dependent monooxygenase [Enterobacteriaceae bacterium 4M9]|nr:flavin-dependent monooxygenase [Enterobacteriaceae bacterium 4M9]
MEPLLYPHDRQQPQKKQEALGELLEIVRERALTGEFDALRHIPGDIIQRFRQSGVYRALVPARFGGEEQGAAAFCELIEKISHADGSAGWVASFGMSPVYLAALPLETLRKVYADGPDIVFAGGIFPPQPAQVVAGGMKVRGRWKFASGCMGADLVGVGITPQAGDTPGLPRMAVMPRHRARIEETWDTVGLAGTGSHDLVVEDVVVPEEWTFVRGSAANLDEPIFRYPALAFATQVLSVVGLGVARRALDEVRAQAEKTPSVTGAPALGQRPAALMDIARAEAKLRSARAFFYDAIHEAWQRLLKGDEITLHQANMLRLSSTHAVRVAASVCREMQMMTGMGSIVRNNPLARCVNDAQAITQHAFMGEHTWQLAGAVLCGQPAQPGWL